MRKNCFDISSNDDVIMQGQPNHANVINVWPLTKIAKQKCVTIFAFFASHIPHVLRVLKIESFSNSKQVVRPIQFSYDIKINTL